MSQADNTKIAKAVVATAVAVGIGIAFLARRAARTIKGKSQSNLIQPTVPEEHDSSLTRDASEDSSGDLSSGLSAIRRDIDTSQAAAALRVGQVTHERSTNHSIDIRSESRKRGIKYLVHFTSVDKLEFIAKEGLISNASVRQLGRPVLDELRRDGKPHYICTSITHPNYAMFYKYSCENREGWCVLLLDPSIMWSRQCLFYPFNAASLELSSQGTSMFIGSGAFVNLFANRLGDTDRDNGIPPSMPTSPQAEVLIPGTISPREILSVHFFTERSRFLHDSILAAESIDTVASEKYFRPRSDWKRWS